LCYNPTTAPTNDLPYDLFSMVIGLPGFEATHLNMYFQYLLANKDLGHVFYKFPFEHKLIWVAMFVYERFPGQ
jgi:hypothetical protein